MRVILDKLWASKSTVSILLWVAVFAWAYNLDWAKKPTITHTPAGRSLEEIISTPVDKTTPSAWDNDFKSTVEPIQ